MEREIRQCGDHALMRQDFTFEDDVSTCIWNSFQEQEIKRGRHVKSHRFKKSKFISVKYLEVRLFLNPVRNYEDIHYNYACSQSHRNFEEKQYIMELNIH